MGWDPFGVRSATPYERVLSGSVMPDMEWFTGAQEPIMFTYLSRRGTCPRATTRLRRTIAALAAVTGGLLAWAAAVPAASAATSLIPDPGEASGPVPATAPAAPAQVITSGGMPGWQITLIAVAAAFVAASAAVFLDRARASRRAASAAG